MALLGKSSSAVPLALAAAALAGCVWLQNLGVGVRGLAFSHRRHVREEKLDCANCHADALALDDPGMPSFDTCDVCHADIDPGKAPDRRVQTLFREDRFAAVHASGLSDEVVFSHRLHASKETCESCHRGIETNERAADLRPVLMDDCTGCHATKFVRGGSPDECATCHREVTAEWAPPSHSHSTTWKKRHGPVARAHAEATADRCSLCHTESTCSACHQVEAPENHNQFWRQRGHGITAMMDRENCAACHEPESCERCHAESKPRNHTASFGGTLSTHCLVCHQPLAQEGCVACHAMATSHLLATPKPPDHYPGMDCRACHGVSQPLPHVDNGDDCNSCHL